MKIGELSARTGVPAKTIRYYEQIGVLPSPSRTPNGYRDYQPDAVDRLAFVKDAQSSGFSLNEIASIMELRSQGVGTCEHVLDLMHRHRMDVDRQIETLKRTRDRLSAFIDRAASLRPADCTDPVRCQTIEAGVSPTHRMQRHSISTAHSHHDIDQ